MTNALAQQPNIENKDTAMIDIFVNSSVSKNNNQTANTKTSEFSHFMNSLDARVKKAQNNFEQKAKVTNTSSINQKALEKNGAKKEVKNVDVKKNINNTNAKIDTKKENVSTDKVNIDDKKASKVNKDVNLKNNSVEQKSENTVKNEIKKIDTSSSNVDLEENSSDINNSLQVESSPVFIENQKNVEIEQVEAEDSVDIKEEALSADVLKSISQDEETFKLVEDLLADVENIDDVNKVIEEIASLFQNLNQNQDDELNSSFEDLKTILNNAIKNTEKVQDFDEILSNVKTKLMDIFEQVDLNDLKDVQKITVDFKENENLKLLEELKKFTQISKDDSIEVKEVKEKLTELINNVENSLDEKVVNEEKNIDLKEIKNLFSKLNSNEVNDEEIKKIQDYINEIDLSTKTDEQKLNLKTVEVGETKSIEQVDNKKISEFIEIDTNKVDFEKKESMNEILNLLEGLNEELNLNSSELKIDDEIKKEISREIENLTVKVENVEISAEDVKEAVDDIQNLLKNNASKVSKTNVNVINATEKFENNSSENFNFKEQTNNQELNSDFFENLDVDFNQEIDLKGKVQVNDNLKIQENQQKTIFTNNVLKDMLSSADDITVEVNIKNIPTQSGALSAQDEVIKLSLGEQNSLNQPVQAHGSVTYDSTGANAVIKNVAQLMKSAQVQETQNPSMEEVLNQVTNKITQLKEGGNQKLTMVLRPNDLGRLSIELTSTNQGLVTNIMAQNEDVRAYIEKNIDSLRQQLSDAGVNVNSIQIKTAGQEGSTSYEGNQNFKQEQDSANQDNKNNHNQNQQNRERNDNHKQNAFTLNDTYDMHFAKDFSSILNKSLSYGN